MAAVVVFAVHRHYEVAAHWDKVSIELRPALSRNDDAPEPQPAHADGDWCPGAGLKVSCHLDEASRCECSRRQGSSVTVCAWVCAPRP
jgi:hypothetical protein